MAYQDQTDRMNREVGSRKLEVGSGNAAFDKLRRDKVGNWNWEVGMRHSTSSGETKSEFTIADLKRMRCLAKYSGKGFVIGFWFNLSNDSGA